ncbi:MAG: hypothetical protein QG610_133 [Euryarchaeota archaeon]|nr:hypothetical protein [Euryarchaeota archaeon]
MHCGFSEVQEEKGLNKIPPDLNSKEIDEDEV